MIAPLGGVSNVLGWLATVSITQTGGFLLAEPINATLGYLPQVLTDPGPLTLNQSARFLVALPASGVLTTPITGSITYTLPEATAQAHAVTCTMGTCRYSAELRTVTWQGPLQAGDLAFLSFEISFRQSCPPRRGL